MGNRDNLKIILSAVLIVLVAALGIYAFLYRDKISQILPSYSTKPSLERDILPPTEQQTYPSSSTADTTSSGYDKLMEDEELMDYPAIPKPPMPSKLSEATESSPTPTQVPVKPLPSSPPTQAMVPNESISKQSIGKTSQTSRVLSTKQQQKRKEIPKSKTTAQKSPTKSTVAPNYKQTRSSYSPTTTPSTSLETRISRLEKKFEVHMQDTKSRLDSLEKRIEKLEKEVWQKK